MISAIVLAAGESRRMGRENKLLLEVGEQLMIQKVVKTIMASKVDEVIVVTGYQAEKIQAALGKLEVKVVHNPDYYSGMTSGIQAGCTTLDPESRAFLVCLADMPKLQTGHYNALITKFDKEKTEDSKPIIRPFYHDKIGNPVIFDAGYQEEVLLCKDNEGCKTVLSNNKENLTLWPIGNTAYYEDVDTKLDYYKL